MKFFEYQIKDSEWLARQKRAYLAHEMGLGKSAIAIRASELVRAKRVLVVAPASVTQNWYREFQKFRKSMPEALLTVSYDSLWRNRDLPTFGSGFDVIIFDEAHYLKNPKAKRTNAALGASGLLARSNARVWFLSGTPIPNHAAELWPVLAALGKTSLSYRAFVQQYCHSYEPKRGVVAITGTRREMLPELNRLVKSFMLRRRAKEVLKDLPAISFSTIEVTPVKVPLESKDVSAKLDLELSRLAELEGLSPDEAYDFLTAEAQSISTVRRIHALEKAAPLADLIIDELEADKNRKVIVFGSYLDSLQEFRMRLQKKNIGNVMVTGSTPVRERQRCVDDFQTLPGTRVFIGSIRAAGTGITLTAANQVVFLDQDFVPGENAQAAKRAHRIGQDKPVFVRVVHGGGVDYAIQSTLARKTAEIAGIIDHED